jgi:hypothetical protein
MWFVRNVFNGFIVEMSPETPMNPHIKIPNVICCIIAISLIRLRKWWYYLCPQNLELYNIRQLSWKIMTIMCYFRPNILGKFLSTSNELSLMWCIFKIFYNVSCNWDRDVKYLTIIAVVVHCNCGYARDWLLVWATAAKATKNLSKMRWYKRYFNYCKWELFRFLFSE